MELYESLGEGRKMGQEWRRKSCCILWVGMEGLGFLRGVNDLHTFAGFDFEGGGPEEDAKRKAKKD